uniref:Uncharacterized protein n=1 Tax=Oryza barthii TaxID=65489 RepID=A0A0D3GCM3_9ORYZ
MPPDHNAAISSAAADDRRRRRRSGFGRVQQMDINLETGFLGFGVFVATMQIKAAKIWLQIPLYDRLWF